jgi:hypothetical protein
MKTPILQARHDPAHCLAPGLFQSFKRGDRKHLKLDVTYDFNEDTSLRFRGYEPLGADDLRLLQGILALAGTTKTTIPLAQPESKAAKQLVLFLEPKDNAVHEHAVALRTTIQRLMAEIGYKTDGGEARKDVIESLDRLSNVTMRVVQNTKSGSIHLLSYFMDEATGDLVVAVNHRLTQAIMGDHAYTHIDMREVRALSSDAARILHQRLSAIVSPGKQRPFNLATLISYVWPLPATGSTLRMRRSTLRAAISEIEKTGGWLFTLTKSGAYQVGRRSVGYEPPAPAQPAAQESLL